MPYDERILSSARRRLTREHLARVDAVAQIRREAFDQDPDLAQIDQKLRATMPRVVAAALRKGKSPVDEIRRCREQNLALQKEEHERLAALGFAPDALEEKLYCPLCNDTGWIGTQMCQCLQKLCNEEQIRELSKLLDLGSQSFETFRLDYYSDVRDPQTGYSPRDRMNVIFRVCRRYAVDFAQDREPRNLFLSGPPGLGKTFLSACIARTVSEADFSVVYDTANNIFRAFEDRKFQYNEEEGRDARDETRRYLSCDLLILDDLGTELTTQFTQSTLYELINTRLAQHLRTVISSNIPQTELKARYSAQTVSRLEGEYQLLQFLGQDIRQMKKKQM